MLSLANKKNLKIVITLGTKSFGDYDQVILQSYRASVSISLAGGLQYGQLDAQIYGMNPSDMAAITTYAPRVGAFKPNTVLVYAIDGEQESLIFTGNIVTAWADYQSMPNVHLNIQAQAAYDARLKMVPPRSFKGAVNVSTVMNEIARSMGYSFVDNGVNVILENIYLPDSGMNQAQKLADMASITMIVENQTIIISPKGKPRASDKVIISAKTGMVGYPTFDGVTVICRTLFNPAIAQFGLINIETDVQNAAGDWMVLSMNHNLDSENPGGQWFSTIQAVNPKLYGR